MLDIPISWNLVFWMELDTVEIFLCLKIKLNKEVIINIACE